MYKKNFEFILRKTKFSEMVFEEIWDFLGSTERIYFLLNFMDELAEDNIIVKKALEDSNPFIRMLAVRASFISEDWDNLYPGLYNKIKTDESLLVQMALKTNKVRMDTKNLEALSHTERLAVIALSDHLFEESFAEFICDGLKNNLFSEREASEMLIEYVRNPNMINIDIGYWPDDDSWLRIGYMQKNFDVIWNLTTCTSANVHYVIANEFPLYLSNGYTIPKKILNNMSEDALERLIWRGYTPLINDINNNLESYSSKIINTLRKIENYKEEERENILLYKVENNPLKDNSNDDLNEKFDDFCVKVNYRLDKMYEEFKEILSKSKEIFS